MNHALLLGALVPGKRLSSVYCALGIMRVTVSRAVTVSVCVTVYTTVGKPLTNAVVRTGALPPPPEGGADEDDGTSAMEGRISGFPLTSTGTTTSLVGVGNGVRVRGVVVVVVAGGDGAWGCGRGNDCVKVSTSPDLYVVDDDDDGVVAGVSRVTVTYDVNVLTDVTTCVSSALVLVLVLVVVVVGVCTDGAAVLDVVGVTTCTELPPLLLVIVAVFPFKMLTALCGSVHPIIMPSTSAMGSARHTRSVPQGTTWNLPAPVHTPCAWVPRQATLPGVQGVSGVSAPKAVLSCFA